MCHYEVTTLAKNNPHVKDEEVRAFMGRYMDNVSSARLLKDSLGFWNGRRSFQALLREDPKGLGGYLHPPALFSLGADRGTLFYARQPPFCRRCMAYGHNLASCGAKKCRVCGSEAHEARDCDESKKCHGCGSSAHLWRECTAHHKSYAAATGGGAGAGAGEGGGRGGGVPDPSTGPEAIPSMTEEEPRTAAGGEGDCRSSSGRRGGAGDGDRGRCGRGGRGEANHSPGRRGEGGRGGAGVGGKGLEGLRSMCEGVLEWWEIAKVRMRVFIIGYCKKKKREERREVDQIQRLLQLELEAGNLGGAVDVEQGNVFLEYLSRRVPEDIREVMEAQISLEEVESALRRMGKGKVPGMDGLPAEFYLKFWGKLCPVVLEVLKAILETGSRGYRWP
ncbi:unnamed protein product [Coregonus sp. 'balchen']|nr:unnamed protein product [Coregonus sp. 'balchen']